MILAFSVGLILLGFSPEYNRCLVMDNALQRWGTSVFELRLAESVTILSLHAFLAVATMALQSVVSMK